MIRVDCLQGSAEWHAARLGVPTASQFHRILSPRSLKPSAQAERYLCELAAERILGTPLDSASSEFMERGKALEDEAVAWFELQRGVDTEKIGFALTDDRRAGCSPDRLVGADEGLEIKCPSPAIHVGYLLGDISEEYRLQVQGGLWVTGRKRWNLLSYSPLLPSALVVIERDREAIEALESALDEFCKRLDEATERLADLVGVPA